ncbi:MAG: zinc ribbon domain-containing protein [Methylomonas sp.]|nr:zinc ribbon domain-containing protein [Methylomonas sp.]
MSLSVVDLLFSLERLIFIERIVFNANAKIQFLKRRRAPPEGSMLRRARRTPSINTFGGVRRSLDRFAGVRRRLERGLQLVTKRLIFLEKSHHKTHLCSFSFSSKCIHLSFLYTNEPALQLSSMQVLQDIIKKQSTKTFGKTRKTLPPQNVEYQKTWFNISETNFATRQKNRINVSSQFEAKKDELIRCKQVSLTLNDDQREIMLRWMYAYVQMYNATIDFINTAQPKTISWIRIRTDNLKTKKEEIRLKSQHPRFMKNTKIVAHSLDGAIKLACANYKSGLSNIRAKNISHFRIRKWRVSKKHLLIDIESSYFRNNTLCEKIFGKIQLTYNNLPFETSRITSECRVLFNRIYNNFTLLVPESITAEKTKADCSIIALDPGLRTFMTGVSEKGSVAICGKKLAYDKIGKQLKRIDNAKKVCESKKKQQRIERRCHRKIEGMITELHWKTAKYLTENYETILIGDLSAKGISSNNIQGGISDKSKRIAYALSFFKFRERLAFKCQQYSRNFTVVDEHFTSKLCSHCGECKSNLGGDEVYNCANCHSSIGRDVNGARNILLRCMA